MTDLDYGRIPPQAIEIEQAVLGAMIIDQNCIDQIQMVIQPEYFYRESHQILCSSIFQLRAKGNPVDMYSLIEFLKKSGNLEKIGGVYCITQLSSMVASSANVDYHARIILEKYLLRKVIETGDRMINLAFQNNSVADEVLAGCQSEVNNLIEKLSFGVRRELTEIITDTLTEMHYQKNNPEKAFGVPTPLTKLNRITNGWQNSDLIILAGRPSMGKTAFALANVRAACEAGKKVAVFSLEMKDTQLMKRLILSFNQPIDESGGVISTWGLTIDEKPTVSLPYISGTSRALKRISGLDLVVIDYLQLMEMPAGELRTYQIGIITRGLKQLAKELDIPVILLCQLSREVEKRSNREPELSDLRESGDIEQDADIVIFVYRPFMYGIESDKDGNSTRNMTVLKVSKHRNGPAGDKIKARNNDAVNTYEDWEVENFELNQRKDAF